MNDETRRAVVIKIGSRYFDRISTGRPRRVLTAWSLAGAYHFTPWDDRLKGIVLQLEKMGKAPRVVEVRTAAELVMLACGKCGRTVHLERDMLADLLGCERTAVEAELAKEEDVPLTYESPFERRAFTCPWCGFDGPETYHLGLPENKTSAASIL